MLNVSDIFNCLQNNGVNCFCGVPDSLLKDFCAYVTDHTDNKHHTICANEGNAIGLACGHYLATSNVALVYMQNSGLGNCVNPLLSLADEDVYNIPLLMFIGWRGEPGKKDEPQHVKQGKVTDKLLEAMGIEYEVLSDSKELALKQIEKAFEYMRKTSKPYAFMIRKGTFEPYQLINKSTNTYSMSREEAISKVVDKLTCQDIIVSTTGMISRELYEIRNANGQSHKQDFLTVGSMGHSSSIALGIALEKPNRNVFCFDGDGALLMHQGALTVNATKGLTNFKHIVFNNEAHDSVGSQPTAIYMENISKVALDCGYKSSFSVKTSEELESTLAKFITCDGPALLEIKVKCGARKDLGRPKEKPTENKELFIDHVSQVTFEGKGSISKLVDIVKENRSKKVLFFTGKTSFQKLENLIAPTLDAIKELGVLATFYNAFSVNPKQDELEKAKSALNKDFDLIIAIGGGSVIDFAKAFKYLNHISSPLVAIPTTAGSGAEATKFAVVYKDGVKTSIEASCIKPNYCILEPLVLVSNSSYQKACSAIDALCQAIESYWSVNSTNCSKSYAKQAIKLILENIVGYVKSTQYEDCFEKMFIAANLAGKAINISKTTAAHALSYPITTLYHIPHGHAVALNLVKVYELNKGVVYTNIQDPRGVEYVKSVLSELDELFNGNLSSYFKTLCQEIGIDLNVEIDRQKVEKLVNLQRLQNNPVKMYTRV